MYQSANHLLHGICLNCELQVQVSTGLDYHAFASPRALFGLQTMYVAEWSPEQGWKGEMRPYGPLQLDPSAQVGCMQEPCTLCIWKCRLCHC